MFYSIIFCYLTDSEGEYDPEDDLYAKEIISARLTPELAIDSGALDIFYEGLNEGATVKFEIFNVQYLKSSMDLDSTLEQRIRAELDTMLNQGELSYVEDYEFYAKVKNKSEGQLEG